MTDSGSAKGPSLQAEEKFADYVMRRERGEAVDFEELCRENPDLDADLRRLENDWNLLETVCVEKLGDASLVQTMLIRGDSSKPESPENPGAEARGLFSDYLLAVESKTASSFDDFCKAHPELEEQLRALHAHWSSFEETIANVPGADGTVAKTLLIRHGRDALEDAEWESTRSDLLIERLLENNKNAGHGYKMCGEVARGGMGAILKVWDPNLRRNLAMKVIHEGHGQSDIREESSSVDNILARFLEEAQVTGQLDHPGIVPVYELGVDEQGRCYFTMRLVRGRDLLKIYELVWAEREGWNTTRALTTLLTVCDAMSYAHSKKVLHRDLKPANVMVGRFGETYVMDWGLARVIGKRENRDIRPDADEAQQSIVNTDRRGGEMNLGGDDLRTMDGDVIGTPAYMAPEQARGALDDIGTHTDVYSIGAMLYHLLAKHAPYVEPAKRQSGQEIWHRVLGGPPASLDELDVKAPAELVAICDKAMAREISDRYADTKQLGEDIRAFLEGRVVKAYETGPVAEFRKWVGRNRVAAGTVFSTIGVIVAGLAVLSVAYADDAKTERKVAKAAVVEKEQAVVEKKQAVVEKEVAVVEKEDAIAEKLIIEQQKIEIEKQRKAAEDAAEEARSERAKVLRLADGKRLQQLESRARDLWPAVPALVPDLNAWLSPATELADGLDSHRTDLANLRAVARSRTSEQLQNDRASHPRAGELRRLGDRLVQLGSMLADLAAEQTTVAIENEIVERTNERTQTQADYDALEAEINAFRVWEFESSEDQWHHDLLSELVDDLGEFRDPSTGALTSVEQRIELANRIQAESIEQYSERWDAAIASIANEEESPAYGGLLIKPQMGLVPLARDKTTGLWEFVHIASGTVPELDENGKYTLAEDTGTVLVLIPGATTRLGAQPPSRELDLIKSDPNVYDAAWEDEGPIHELELDAFFIGKYEMTQGQWLYATGTQPSTYGPIEKGDGQSRDLLHPVESVSWSEAQRTLWQLGLSLPTESQWEYAARGGTIDPWWLGDRDSKLNAKVNLADQFARKNGGPENWDYNPRISDGFVVHAPVNKLAANPFGLYHVAGNVTEWCLDGYALYEAYEPAERDGYRDIPAPDKLVARGGSFRDNSDELRSAFRHRYSPDDRRNFLGLRAVRAVQR